MLSGAFDKNPQRRNHREPDAAADEPQMPGHLSDTAADKWQETAERLREMGILSDTYADVLELYATTYARYREAQSMIDRIGIAIVHKLDGKVTITRNPFETASHKYRDALVKIESELGLTPSAKSRINSPKKAVGISTRKRTG